MFCFQCQEAAKGTGCTLKGVCGKESTTSAMMDLLLFTIRGLSVVATELRNHGFPVPKKVNGFIMDGLFTTITNANFDEKCIVDKIEKGFQMRNDLLKEAHQKKVAVSQVDEVTWNGSYGEYADKAKEVGVLREENEDLRSLKELITYGLKGISAYQEHASRLGFEKDEIYAFVQQTFSNLTTKNLSIDQLVTLTLKTGEWGVQTMALLDYANTKSYGNPEITQVNVGVRNNPAILISGHDLKDLEQLLEQTEGTGIDVYTHSEMLPGHYYPKFKKYSHFVGNYGGSWWHQREEFEKFNGAILFTTNCIVPPLPTATYKDRMFTTNSAGFPGCRHIIADEKGCKDFSEVIDKAKQCPPPTELEKGSIVGGFAHEQVFKLADKIVEAVKNGSIREFVVMAGCDGRMKDRYYYTEFAESLPHDTIILTAGCAKYRYNKLNLGDIGGIPRVLDAGQCNDSYSLALIALKLKEVFGLDDINKLPIVYNIAWYEQKAVIVLLSLLSLGVKNIHLGPTLPAFLSTNVRKVLIEKFNIGAISTVKEDIRNMIDHSEMEKVDL